MAFDHAFHRAVLQDFLGAVRDNTEPAVTGDLPCRCSA